MLKKILLCLFSLFLIWQSHIQITGSLQHPVQSLWATVLVAFIINLYVTGAVAFPSFAFPIERLFPDSYYKVTNSKRLKNVFKLMHVEGFRSFLLATFWRNKDQRNSFFDGTKAGIVNLERRSMNSEFGHLIALIVLVVISVLFLIKGQVGLALLITLINVLGNLYPIILQRHHRMRVSIMKRRMGFD